VSTNLSRREGSQTVGSTGNSASGELKQMRYKRNRGAGWKHKKKEKKGRKVGSERGGTIKFREGGNKEKGRRERGSNAASKNNIFPQTNLSQT